MTNYIGKNIKHLRKKKKLSQQALAKKIGLSRSNIAAYEAGNSEPGVAKLTKLAMFFDIKLEDFIGKELSKNHHVSDNLREHHNNIDIPKSVTLISKEALLTLSERTSEVEKMVEGFKAFYNYRMKSEQNLSPGFKILSSNMENVLHAISYLIATNKAMISSVHDLES